MLATNSGDNADNAWVVNHDRNDSEGVWKAICEWHEGSGNINTRYQQAMNTIASDSLAHKIAHSLMVPKQQQQQPANQPTLGEDAGFSQRGGNTAWHLGTTLASGDSFPPLMK